MGQPDLDVTALLNLAHGGDPQAQDELFRVVEGELRRLAHARLHHEMPAPGLQTTLLVDDAYLKLIGVSGRSWESRSQFYCFAARVMREVLVGEARRRARTKRGGGGRAVSLDQVPTPQAPSTPDPLTLLALHEALAKLAADHPELNQIVELHYFAGWELKQIAEDILGVPYTTITRRWQKARALLYRALSGGDDDADVPRTAR
jgi:RNA polymerase sigma factor (TIGR02999 family)